MKKFSFILAILMVSISAVSYAQAPVAGSPDSNFAIYKNKLKKSEEQKENPKKNVKPDFWIDRAELMMDIFNVDRLQLVKGTQQIQVKLFYTQEPKEKKTWTEEGSNFERWEYDRLAIIFSLATTFPARF